MDQEKIFKLSNILMLGMNQNAQNIAYVLDLCYRGTTNIEHISYTIAVLHCLSQPNEAQHIINLGLPFSPEGFWSIVESLSGSAFGQMFAELDGRKLTDALVTRDQTVTYVK